LVSDVVQTGVYRQLLTELVPLNLEATLPICNCLDVFGESFLALLRLEGGLAELLILLLVAFEDGDKLLLLVLLDLGLLLVGLDLLFEFLRLRVNLRRQRVLDAVLFALLLIQLLVHHPHLLHALLRQLLKLGVQFLRLPPDHLVLLLRARYVVGHLRLDCSQVLVKVLHNLFALADLVIRYLSVALLELSVLTLVLPRYLLVLLPNDLCLSPSVLVLECLLVV